MSAHVLLNLLSELGKGDKMRGLPSILLLFRNSFDKFNNTIFCLSYDITITCIHTLHRLGSLRGYTIHDTLEQNNYCVLITG